LPYRGNLITVNGAQCTVPDAGVTLAATGLTPNHLYYIFAVATAGVVTSLEAGDSGSIAHATSTTAGNKGVEIKSGDDTRTLVGMARVISGPAWQDSAAQRFVVSWFNRRGISCNGGSVTISGSIGSGLGERTSSSRCEFLAWSDEAVFAQCQVSMRSTSNGTLSSRVDIDGATFGDTVIPDGVANLFSLANAIFVTSLGEGYHYSTWDAAVQNGSGTATVTNMAQIGG
jgi:hypothetical protein